MKEGCSIKAAVKEIHKGEKGMGNLPSGQAPKTNRESLRKDTGPAPSKDLAKA